MIRIKKTNEFNIDDFGKEIKHELWHPHNPKEEYWFLLPNKKGISSHAKKFEWIGSFVNPNIDESCLEFSQNTKHIRDKITVEHEVVWGVLLYTY